MPLGNLIAAKAHEFIDSLSDNLIYLDQANQLRAYGGFRNLFTSKAVLLSQAVQDELVAVLKSDIPGFRETFAAAGGAVDWFPA